MSPSCDHIYYEEGPLELVISPGEVKELKYNVKYGGNVAVKILAARNPITVSVSCSGVDVASQELREGMEEYNFTVDPDTELLIRLEGKRGLLANRARVTVEVKMYTTEKVVELSREIDEIYDMAKYMGTVLYEIKRDRIMELMKEVMKFWRVIGCETKNKVREIACLVERSQGKTSIADELAKLKRMLDEKLITIEEFEKAKKIILRE
ncbi:MAG: SHOCT domain-containing protein [Candidatus Nezhaarchaeales archaeon]